jgi:hypothetical protein
MTQPKSERNIQALILMALSEAGCLVWRQDTGAYKAPDGRLIRYGLCKGSSDVIGVAPSGQFLAIEVKTATGRVSPEQTAFLDAVRRAGGRAGVARSVDEALAIALD